MREIKFRVFDKQFKFMSEIDDMDLLVNNNGIYERHCIDYQGDVYKNADDRYILMQYTGLKDKNGVEIYEGDVVHANGWSMSPYEGEMKNKNRVVAHSNYRISGFVLDTVDGETVYSGKGLCTTNAKHMEVIGNIHENPELVKGASNELR